MSVQLWRPKVGDTVWTYSLDRELGLQLSKLRAQTEVNKKGIFLCSSEEIPTGWLQKIDEIKIYPTKLEAIRASSEEIQAQLESYVQLDRLQKRSLYEMSKDIPKNILSTEDGCNQMKSAVSFVLKKVNGLVISFDRKVIEVVGIGCREEWVYVINISFDGFLNNEEKTPKEFLEWAKSLGWVLS